MGTNDNDSPKDNDPLKDSRPKGYWRMTDDEYYTTYRNASAAWYLLPIFFGIIGGVIMWLVLRNEDPRKAKKGLILSIILSVVWVVFWFIIFAVIAATVPTTTTNPSIQYPAV
jgi:uncharacterized Tic20 family protein